MIDVIRSEWTILNRARLWIGVGSVTAAFVAVATWLVIAAAEPAGRGGGAGVTLEALHGAGGATTAVVTSAAFSSVLVFAAFASSIANEFARGTLRVALTHSPRRWSLIAGKLAARLGVAVVVLLVAMVVGWATAAFAGPASGVSTAGWFGLDAFGAAGEDVLRLAAFVAGFGLLGTVVAVLVRSTPVTLAVGLLWFGPIENVIGEDRAWAARWFPGLLLRAVLRPDAPDMVSTTTAAVTLAAYAVCAAAVAAAVLARRDVTS